jgi:hypothetical protein
VGQHGGASGSILFDLDGFEVLAAVLAGGEWRLGAQTLVTAVGWGTAGWPLNHTAAGRYGCATCRSAAGWSTWNAAGCWTWWPAAVDGRLSAQSRDWLARIGTGRTGSMAWLRGRAGRTA